MIRYEEDKKIYYVTENVNGVIKYIYYYLMERYIIILRGPISKLLL